MTISFSASLCLSFHLYTMGVIIEFTTNGYYEDYDEGLAHGELCMY